MRTPQGAWRSRAAVLPACINFCKYQVVFRVGGFEPRPLLHPCPFLQLVCCSGVPLPNGGVSDPPDRWFESNQAHDNDRRVPFHLNGGPSWIRTNDRGGRRPHRWGAEPLTIQQAMSMDSRRGAATVVVRIRLPGRPPGICRNLYRLVRLRLLTAKPPVEYAWVQNCLLYTSDAAD